MGNNFDDCKCFIFFGNLFNMFFFNCFNMNGFICFVIFLCFKLLNFFFFGNNFGKMIWKIDYSFFNEFFIGVFVSLKWYLVWIVFIVFVVCVVGFLNVCVLLRNSVWNGFVYNFIFFFSNGYDVIIILNFVIFFKIFWCFVWILFVIIVLICGVNFFNLLN